MDGGAQQDRIDGGSQAVSLALRSKLGDSVRLASPVTTIRGWNTSGPVQVETPHGTVEAARVILALSPSQAAEIRFDPPLPPARQAILDGWPRNGSGFTMHFGYPTPFWRDAGLRSEEHTSELQSLMRISYAVFCLKKKKKTNT